MSEASCSKSVDKKEEEKMEESSNKESKKEEAKEKEDKKEESNRIEEDKTEESKTEESNEEEKMDVDSKEEDKMGESKKEPTPPKRPLTAYLFYCGQERQKIRTRNPIMSPKSVMREVGRRWYQLDPKVKATYENEAAVDKERYEKEWSLYKSELAAYQASIDEKKKAEKPNAEKPNAEKPKDGKRPESPNSAYRIFYHAEVKRIREANPTKQNLLLFREVAENWAELDNDGRQPWVDKAMADQERFDVEMSAYKGAKQVEKDTSDEHEEKEESSGEHEEKEESSDEHEEKEKTSGEHEEKEKNSDEQKVEEAKETEKVKDV